VGIPYRDKGCDTSGCDCWGLLRLVLAELRGFALPSLHEHYAASFDRAAIAALAQAETSAAWDEVAPGDERELDGVLMRGEPLHIGVVTSPGRTLHVERARTSVIESYRASPLRHRILGFYRFRAP
jgi:cell wall-associated NlpC family hydrolase